MNASRLLQLAEHLETGELGHTSFDLDCYSSGERNAKKYNCGTVGCALGECVFLWPEHWTFIPTAATWATRPDTPEFSNFRDRPQVHYYLPTLILRPKDSPIRYRPDQSASLFFEINIAEVSALFCPDQDYCIDGVIKIPELSPDATRHEVAARIRDFVKWKERSVS